MKTILKSTSQPLQFDVTSEFASIQVGANQDLIDEEKTFRPMELILASLSSCSAIDILTILKKQKQNIVDFQIETTGHRADAIPAVFESIELLIKIEGEVDEQKLVRAINLTKDKYCSVYRMLSPTVEISINYQILK